MRLLMLILLSKLHSMQKRVSSKGRHGVRATMQSLAPIFSVAASQAGYWAQDLAASMLSCTAAQAFASAMGPSLQA